MTDNKLSQISKHMPTAAERRSNVLRYIVEVLSSVTILVWGYHLAGAHGSVWAIITAILILQPGLDASLGTSSVRIIATLIGASVGTAVALPIGRNSVAVLAGLVVTILICYLLRLDTHLRQACLTVPIVQMWPDNSIAHVDYERITAIVVGCIVPLIAQFVDVQIRNQIGRLSGRERQGTVSQSHDGAK
jgi:uncharacterized membrane protein YgaE (UPF0421/DUF939 family)